MRTTIPPSLSVEMFCTLCDGLTEVIRALRGAPDLGIGAGRGLDVPIEDDFGYSRAAREYESIVMSIPHYPTSDRLVHNAHIKTVHAGDRMVLAHVHELLTDLSNVCAATGIAGTKRRLQNIAEFAAHFNTGPGGPYRALVSREVADMYELLYKGRKFGEGSIYAPAIVLASRAVGEAVAVAGLVDKTLYAGASIRATVEGYEGDPGQLTAVGNARMAHGGVAADVRTWSVMVEGDGEYDMLPDVDGDICVAVQNIGFPAYMKSGTVTVSTLLPERLLS